MIVELLWLLGVSLLIGLWGAALMGAWLTVEALRCHWRGCVAMGLESIVEMYWRDCWPSVLIIGVICWSGSFVGLLGARLVGWLL